MEYEKDLVYYPYQKIRMTDPKSGHDYWQLQQWFVGDGTRGYSTFHEAESQLYRFENSGTVVPFNRSIKAPDIIECEIVE